MPPKRNIGRNQLSEFDLPPHLRGKKKGVLLSSISNATTSKKTVRLAVICKAGDALAINEDGNAILASNAIADAKAMFIATISGTPGQRIEVASDGDIVDIDEAYTLSDDELVWLSNGANNISNSESFDQLFSQVIGFATSSRKFLVNIQEEQYNE